MLLSFARLVALSAFAAIFLGFQPARAVESVNVPLDGRTLDLTRAIQLFHQPNDRIQVSTAPGSDGIVRRIEVRALEGAVTSDWAVFALANNGDEQIDRLLVAPHFRLAGSGLFWPDLGASRIAKITPSQGFAPDRQSSQDADVFRVTLDPGAVMTVKDLITMMIIVSDNTATEVLFRMVGGPDAVNARMQALGLKTTRAMNVPSKWFPALRAAPTTEQFYRDGRFPFGFSTPREMGRLLEMMERGTLVDKASSDLMLRIMRGQLYRTRIPRYVTGYTIPHKTGDFLPYVGDDVGVLEAPGKTIVLTVFTGNHFGSGEALENAIGLVARDVADYFAYRP